MSEQGHTALSSGVVSGAEQREEVTLPSGRQASVLNEPKGRHLALAARLAGPTVIPGTWSWWMAVAAVIVRVDGQPIVLEDIEGFSAADAQALFGLAVGKCQGDSGRNMSPDSASTAGSPTPS